MAFNDIDRATQGYDRAGISAYINEVHIAYVDEVISALERGKTEIESKVDNNWTGKSAENYKKKMDKHFDSVEKALNQAKDLMDQTINKVGAQIDNVDQSIF